MIEGAHPGGHRCGGAHVVDDGRCPGTLAGRRIPREGFLLLVGLEALHLGPSPVDGEVARVERAAFRKIHGQGDGRQTRGLADGVHRLQASLDLRVRGERHLLLPALLVGLRAHGRKLGTGDDDHVERTLARALGHLLIVAEQADLPRRRRGERQSVGKGRGIAVADLHHERAQREFRPLHHDVEMAAVVGVSHVWKDPPRARGCELHPAAPLHDHARFYNRSVGGHAHPDDGSRGELHRGSEQNERGQDTAASVVVHRHCTYLVDKRSRRTRKA